MDRREFLKKSLLLTAGSLVGGSLFAKTSSLAGLADVSKREKTIGLQLYSLRDAFSKDVPGTLKLVSQIGYKSLETASYGDGKLYGYAPKDFRTICEDLGMKVTGAHIGREYKREEDTQIMDFWRQALDAQAEVGCTSTVMPWFSIGDTLDSIKVYCDYFNRVGELAAERGLKFGFHNHAGEFAEIEGQVIFDYMVANTDPQNVMFELDVYWIEQGGKSAVEYIDRYGDRIRLLHIKDECAIGESGAMDFESIFKAAYRNKIKEYYVEVERYTVSPEADVQRSFDYLNSAKFVK